MRSISARIRAVDRRRAVVSILNLVRRLSFFRGRRAQDTGACKSKDYVACPAKLVQVVRVEKYPLCKVVEDGHRIEFEELVCRDDGHAVHLAKRVVQDHDVEVWKGTRFVFRLECKRR
jgi:hypothetical protein